MKLSTALSNANGGTLGCLGAMTHGRIELYSGSQPADADASIGGATLLGTITLAGAALTKETRGTATLTVTDTDGSALTGVTVEGLSIVTDMGGITANADTSVTAAALAALINRGGMAEASATTNVVTVKPRPGIGARWNGKALATAGVTSTGSNFAGGVNPSNGLIPEMPSSRVLTKPAAAVWSMLGVTIGTATWFRWYSSDTADAGAADTDHVFCRIDGTCGVGSGDARLSSQAVTVGSPHTVQSLNVTFAGA